MRQFWVCSQLQVGCGQNTLIALPCATRASGSGRAPRRAAATRLAHAIPRTPCPLPPPRNALHAYPDDNAHKGPAQVVRQVSLVSTVRYQGELSRLCGTLRIVFPPTHTHPESYFRMADYTPSEGRGLIYGQCTYTGHIY